MLHTFFLITALIGWAQDIAPECIWAYYRASYAEDYVHTCRDCPEHVAKFLRRMKNEGHDISQFKVVVFRDPVYPKQFRDPATEAGWEWHFATLNNHRHNQILDHDYSLTPGEPDPAIVSVNRYVETNFGSLPDGKFPNQKYIRDVRVRVIDGNYYLRVMGNVVSPDRPTQKTKVIDANYMMRANLGPNAENFNSLEDFVRKYGNKP